MAKKTIKASAELKVENKEQLVSFIDNFAAFHRAKEILDKKVKDFQTKLAPLIRMFYSIENGESQAKTPSECRIAETDLARVSVTSPFILKDGEKIPEQFKTGESTVITDMTKALEVIKEHAPELLGTAKSYDLRAYWESLDKAKMHEKFDIGTPTVKCKVKGKLTTKEISAVEKEIETKEKR
jgi:hypothetical protein